MRTNECDFSSSATNELPILMHYYKCKIFERGNPLSAAISSILSILSIRIRRGCSRILADMFGCG